jgi:hypothetical protein
MSTELQAAAFVRPSDGATLGEHVRRDDSFGRRRVGNGARVSVDDAYPRLVAPVERLALTQEEACASLGCSDEWFVEHIRPHLRIVRGGRKRIYPVDELRRVLDDLAEAV